VPDFGLARGSRRGPSGPAALLRVRPPLTRRVRSARSAAHRAQAPLLGAAGRHAGPHPLRRAPKETAPKFISAPARWG
jgi:hypothetical protein